MRPTRRAPSRPVLLVAFAVALVAFAVGWASSRARSAPSTPPPPPPPRFGAPYRPPPRPPLRPTARPPRREVVGFLEGDGGETRPLVGWRSNTRKYRWHYETANDAHHHQLRMPVSSVADRGRKCTAELGCRELFDGDTVSVPGAGGEMRVHLYES